MKPDHQSKKQPNRVFSYDYETAGSGPARWGFLFLIPFLLILGTWASFAQLSAAAIAGGEVVLNHDRKTIQHLEGGIVDDILITEGQTVERGQPILVIRDVAQRTRMNTLYDQLASARALQSRLVAERDETDAPDFSDLVKDIDLSDTRFASLRRMQTRLFESRRTAISTKINLIEARKISTANQVEGLRHQLRAVRKRLDLVDSERASVESLYKKKLVTANRVMALERITAQLDGELGALGANIAGLEQAILAADIEIIDLETGARNEVLQELQKAQLNVQELTHQMSATTDQLARTIIKAPAQGVVLDLQVHTKGAVVLPGQRLLDIVPEDDRLVVEARLKPSDIDIVTTGTKVKVLLSAYKAKKVPKLDGSVLHVSPDIFTDKVTGERYFMARVLVSDEMLGKLKADIALYPGMPAQVFFLAGERTVADYLLSPITEATYRAFREE